MLLGPERNSSKQKAELNIFIRPQCVLRANSGRTSEVSNVQTALWFFEFPNI